MDLPHWRLRAEQAQFPPCVSEDLWDIAAALASLLTPSKLPKTLNLIAPPGRLCLLGSNPPHAPQEGRRWGIADLNTAIRAPPESAGSPAGAEGDSVRRREIPTS